MPRETYDDEGLMYRLGILLLFAALLAGCTPEVPQPTPTAVPVLPTPPQPTAVSAPSPVPTAPMPAATVVSPPPAATAVPAPTGASAGQSDIRCAVAGSALDIPQEIDEVVEQLGFAIQPTQLPAGFALAGVSSSNDEVRQIYQMDEKNIIVAYPIEFSPDAQSDPLGWERPLDAVNSVQAGDQIAHFMVGGWSDTSIIAGPALRPDRAVWDYEKSMALFFTCRVGGGRDVDMAIQALPGPIDWIDANEMLEIAHSLKRVSRSQ